MVEAVAMTITGAPEMGMVEVEKVTQAAEVMSTQVVVIVLEDKTEDCPLLWKGAILLHGIHTAAQAAEHPEVAAVEGVALIEVEAEADTKPLKLLDQISFFLKQMECGSSTVTPRGLLKSCFYLFLLLPVKFPSMTYVFCEKK